MEAILVYLRTNETERVRRMSALYEKIHFTHSMSAAHKHGDGERRLCRTCGLPVTKEQGSEPNIAPALFDPCDFHLLPPEKSE